MHLFKENIRIDSWGVIYLGLVKGWITRTEVYTYAEEGLIKCSDDRLVELYLVEHELLFEFLAHLKRFVKDDDHPIIENNDDSATIDEDQIPRVYYFFWEIESLQKIINNEKNKEEIPYRIELIYSDFHYPASWIPFLAHSPLQGYFEMPIGIDKRYNCLINYVTSMKSRLRKSCLNKLDDQILAVYF